jgi:hypothetical protein
MSSFRVAIAALVVLALAWGDRARAASSGQPVSAFAANVGTKDSGGDGAPGVTLYVVPNGRTFLLTDILVANHSWEVGPLYLSDSKQTRCSIALLQSILLPNTPTGLSSYLNVQTTFSTGIPFGPGEPVVANLANGTRGVDVTISGRLVPGPVLRPVRLPGGARGDGDDERDRGSPE